MKVPKGVIVTCLLLSAAIALGQRGNAGGAGLRPAPTNFPAQQRAPGAPAVVERGKALYEVNCRTCHGADLRGGEQGGTNLLRGQATLNDKAGELIYPIVRDGRRNPGMPPMPAIPISQDDVKAIAEYIHSVLATAQRQGGPPPLAVRPVLNVLAGNAAAGKTYFEAKCKSCHSVDGDLKGIGARITDPMQLQNSWLAGNTSGGRGGRGNAVVAVTVTPSSGPKVEGQLNRIDDFLVIVNLADGTSRSFRRDGDNPKVELRDPRDPHRNMLPEYTDKDIHDVTAYLVTLK